jgi:hypothetical protein
MSKLQGSHYRNAATDPPETGRGSLGIRAERFGNHCSGRVHSLPHVVYCRSDSSYIPGILSYSDKIFLTKFVSWKKNYVSRGDEMFSKNSEFNNIVNDSYNFPLKRQRPLS